MGMNGERVEAAATILARREGHDRIWDYDREAATEALAAADAVMFSDETEERVADALQQFALNDDRNESHTWEDYAKIAIAALKGDEG